MSELILVAGGVVVLIVVIGLLLWRSRGSGTTSRPSSRTRPVSAPASVKTVSESTLDSFTGLKLEPGPNACQAVLDIDDAVYTNDNAPKFPLENCGNPRCACKLVRTVGKRRGERRHHHDRREDVRFDPEKPADRRATGERRKDVGRWGED